MSKIRKSYEGSFFERLERWASGEDGAFDREADGKELERREKEAGKKFFSALEEPYDAGITYWKMTRFHLAYRILAVLFGLFLVAILLYTAYFLPPFGRADNPVNNEVYERYVESGMEETGVVNIVAGMILDYRAFDTFGESNVLFVASSVMLLILTAKGGPRKQKTQRELGMHKDIILRCVTIVLVPMLLILGVYVILNGHISPGGGFSGGAILGGAMILFRVAFEDESSDHFISEKTLRYCTLVALGFYGLAKSYSFFTGANHLESHIPQGTLGNILSGGLILPLNIAVGLVVACTMYSFYELFNRGGI